MRNLRSVEPRTIFRWLGVVGLLLVIAVGVLFWRRSHADRQSSTTIHAGPVAAATRQISSPASAGSAAPSASELAQREALFPSFKKHPFAVTREDSDYAWTAEDGKDPDVIRQLAHNELEFERMLQESRRIIRRQLVYVKKTVDLLVQRSKLSGEPIRRLILPGLDGQEVKFEITRSDLSPSGQQGTFSGHVAGHLDSLVTLAFKGGREAFTIESPSEKLYLRGEPREPGEVVVISFDPNVYTSEFSGDP